MSTLTSDVPGELKEFARLFSALAYRHSSYGEVLSDWLDYAVACFLTTGDPETAQRLERRYGADYPLFEKIFREWVAVQGRMIVGDGDWYDALGIFYEVVASRYKSSWLGQFFTPTRLVDMMCLVHGAGPEQVGKGLRILDPCSGSGRMLVAWHAKAPGNFQFGADVDPVCAKMTALNMLLHGCQGEAVCMNSLSLEWRFGYRVNGYLARLGVPTLERIEATESAMMPHVDETRDATHEAGEAPEPAEPTPPPEAPKTRPQRAKPGQLQLF